MNIAEKTRLYLELLILVSIVSRLSCHGGRDARQIFEGLLRYLTGAELDQLALPPCDSAESVRGAGSLSLGVLRQAEIFG